MNSWMPSIPVERRSRSWLNHRLGSDAVHRQQLQRLRCQREAQIGRPDVLRVQQREDVLDARRVTDQLTPLVGLAWRLSCRPPGRPIDQLDTSVDVVRTEPPTLTGPRLSDAPPPADVVREALVRVSYIWLPLRPMKWPSASPSYCSAPTMPVWTSRRCIGAAAWK